MTNDYMFRVILQKNQFVLKGLIASLLHLEHQNIKNIYITNPIKLGEQIDSKAFVMDIHVILNDDTLLNLEMQLLNTGNWVERSLSYLCRMYDQLQSGDDYAEANTAIHIGFLDFTLFPDYPEFYAHYQMMNTKNHHVFSSKFQLHVLSLKHTELATEEDKRHQIDRWARLFRAKTWEELRMVAQSDNYMSEAAAEIYRMNADEIIKEQCRAREDYYRHERRMKKSLEEAKQETQAAKQEAHDAIQRAM
ncbi:MAG: Rpn family recombination-promoting nuclease/putative transposase, partial [Eubacterium sp.]|nr:Rpn family recombination-promoting nuclease/putative transposase [Eubacterium sp.]